MEMGLGTVLLLILSGVIILFFLGLAVYVFGYLMWYRPRMLAKRYPATLFQIVSNGRVTVTVMFDLGMSKTFEFSATPAGVSVAWDCAHRWADDMREELDREEKHGPRVNSKSRI